MLLNNRTVQRTCNITNNPTLFLEKAKKGHHRILRQKLKKI